MSEMPSEQIEKESPEITEKSGKSGLGLDRFITFAAVIVLFTFFSITARNFFTMRLSLIHI